MTEKCKKTRDVLSLEGRVPDDDAIQDHLDECSECARFLKSLLAVENALQTHEGSDVSDDVVERLLARADLEQHRAPRRASRQQLMGLAAAAIVAFVAARFLFLTEPQPRVLFESDTAENRPTPQLRREIETANERLGGQDLEALRSLGYISGDESEAQLKDVPKREDAQDRLGSRDKLVAQQEFKESDYAQSGLEEEGFDDKNKAAGKVGRASEGSASSVSPETPDLEIPASEAEPSDFDGADAFGVPAAVAGGFMNDPATSEPAKRVHVEPDYPEKAKREGISGVVELDITIDAGGNVTDVRVRRSILGLDAAAVEAVRQWKYVAADDGELRFAVVRVPFELSEPDDGAARSFLEERARIDGLRFQEARGYWANTYVPGDPRLRYLELRLRNAQHPLKPHLGSRPIVQPFDTPDRGALSVFLHADRRGLSEPGRLLVQVGLKAADHHGRRRPPMNVGIVLDTGGQSRADARALIEAFHHLKALGDRFRLILPGRGEVVPPELFRHGPLTLALDQPAEGDLLEALRLAVQQVHAGDDPTMPLGTSLVILVTSRSMGEQARSLMHLAHQSAVGGVPVSVVGVGGSVERHALERLALAGQGRRYFLDRRADASRIVEDELAATSRAVARALRLRIKLAPGVKLVDVLDSELLSERQSERVREAETSIDLRLARNLGIEADRGEDEDGIQIVIPSFYAGDAHTILLDVVAPGPGPIAEVTVRYKDLAELRNTVAKASLSLARKTAANGPLERNVLKNCLALRLSSELERAADLLAQGDRRGAIARIDEARNLLTGLPFGNDSDIVRDVAMLTDYVSALSSSTTEVQLSYLADSLRYAGASKRRLPRALT